MLVIGNGESRKDLDIKSLKLPTVGCNAIFRDMVVDHLVCCDRRMLREALKHENTKKKFNIRQKPGPRNVFYCINRVENA